MTLLRLIPLLLLFVSSHASLKGYEENFILKFINRSQTLDVNEKCRDSLGKVCSAGWLTLPLLYPLITSGTLFSGWPRHARNPRHTLLRIVWNRSVPFVFRAHISHMPKGCITWCSANLSYFLLPFFPKNFKLASISFKSPVLVALIRRQNGIDSLPLNNSIEWVCSAFSLGPSNLFLSRDQDRWVYRGYECLISAGETVYSKVLCSNGHISICSNSGRSFQSEYPMHFCYSHEDTDSKVDAYGVCIPSPCADDHVKVRDLRPVLAVLSLIAISFQLLKQWREMTKPNEASLPMDFTSCTRSRHEKQW